MVSVDTLLRGRYRIGEKIAGGGMGTVFAATDEKLNRKVAVKCLADHLAGDASFVERFRREAQAAAGLSHPNIATVYDYGEEDGCHFIVMEIAEGRDLARVLREEGPLEPERAAPILGQICAALGHAHAAGIVHRDVKPANVILDDEGHVKVTDFGIARAAGDSKLTLTGTVLGTAHYISPEQANGDALTPQSDIYSLGVVAYELLTGALPFTGESLMAVAMRHVSEQVPPPSGLNPGVPVAMDEIVERATSKDPEDRFADTDEMAAALSAATDTAPLAAGSTTPLERQPQTIYPIPGERWDPATLGRRVLIGFAILVVIALGFLTWRLVAQEEPRRERQERAGGGAQREQEPQTSPSAPTEENPSFGPNVIGLDYNEVIDALERDAPQFGYETVFLEGEELVEFLSDNGVSPEDAEEGEVVGTDPPVDVPFTNGEAITLFISSGIEDFEGFDDQNPGKGRGHDKKNDEEGDD